MKLPCMLLATLAMAVLAAPAAAQSYGHPYGDRGDCARRCCDRCDGGHSGRHRGGGYNPTRSTQTGYFSQGYSRYSHSYASHYSYSDRDSYGYAVAPSYYSGGVGYRDDESRYWQRGAYLPEHRSRWYVRDYDHYGYPSPPDDCGYYRTDSGQVVVAHMGSGEVRYVYGGY